MSRENVEVVRRQTAAYVRGDWDEAMSYFDPEVIYDISRNSADGRIYRGLDGVREGFREWIGTWKDYRTELLEVIDAGEDKVVVTTRQTGTGRGSGVRAEMANGVVNTMRNGQIIRMDVYPTRQEALEAVGLRE
jgi:ketosteroid isomerase-like protein